MEEVNRPRPAQCPMGIVGAFASATGKFNERSVERAFNDVHRGMKPSDINYVTQENMNTPLSGDALLIRSFEYRLLDHILYRHNLVMSVCKKLKHKVRNDEPLMFNIAYQNIIDLLKPFGLERAFEAFCKEEKPRCFMETAPHIHRLIAFEKMPLVDVQVYFLSTFLVRRFDAVINQMNILITGEDACMSGSCNSQNPVMDGNAIQLINFRAFLDEYLAVKLAGKQLVNIVHSYVDEFVTNVLILNTNTRLLLDSVMPVIQCILNNKGERLSDDDFKSNGYRLVEYTLLLVQQYTLSKQQQINNILKCLEDQKQNAFTHLYDLYDVFQIISFNDFKNFIYKRNFRLELEEMIIEKQWY